MAQKGKKKEPTLGSEMSRFAGTVTGVAMLVLLFVFPLYITSQNYGNILRAKYKFFWLLVLIMTGVCLIAGLAWVFMDRMEFFILLISLKLVI